KDNILEDDLNYYYYLYYLYKKDLINIYKYGILSKENNNWYEIMSTLINGKNIKKAHSFLKHIYIKKKDPQYLDSYYYMLSELKNKKYSLSYAKESEYISKTMLFLENIGSFDINIWNLKQKSSIEYQKMQRDLIVLNYIINKNSFLELKNNKDNKLNPGISFSKKYKDIDINLGLNLLSKEDRQFINSLTYDYINISKNFNYEKSFLNFTLYIQNLKSLGQISGFSLYNENKINNKSSLFYSFNSSLFKSNIDYSEFSDIFINKIPLNNVIDSYYNDKSTSLGLGIKFYSNNLNYKEVVSVGFYKNINSGEFSGLINYILNSWNNFIFEFNISINNKSEKNYYIKAGRNFE
ncbi:MAG: hypothetical protein M0Q02_07365, partial [Candidatus Muirbacterium halophilum]|nr:hypothetical protein [Candidatus Muirbacterium halophilum]